MNRCARETNGNHDLSFPACLLLFPLRCHFVFCYCRYSEDGHLFFVLANLSFPRCSPPLRFRRRSAMQRDSSSESVPRFQFSSSSSNSSSSSAAPRERRRRRRTASLDPPALRSFRPALTSVPKRRSVVAVVVVAAADVVKSQKKGFLVRRLSLEVRR